MATTFNTFRKANIFLFCFFCCVNSYSFTLVFDTLITAKVYQGFTLYLDCNERALSGAYYELGADTGNQKRSSRFYIDKELPAKCQQLSTSSYRTTTSEKYDRGHLVPANHMDSDPVSIRQSYNMVNVLPQVAQMNRGAWLATEELLECMRDDVALSVAAGPVWADDSANDHFVSSHGVRTPEYYWTVAQSGAHVISWLVPNSRVAKRSKVGSYLVAVNAIEAAAGIRFDLGDTGSANFNDLSFWRKAVGCDRS